MVAAISIPLPTLVAQLDITVAGRPDFTHSNRCYTSNRAPLEPSRLIALPIEAVKPQGWLLEILRRQGSGLCGHLDEISYWLQRDGNGWLSRDGHGKHGWEELAYWLRGYLPLAYLLNDSQMIAKGEFWVKAVIENQRSDGDFGSDLRADQSLPRDLWPNMVMLYCLETYYEHSHDSRVLGLMTRYFAFQLSVPEERFFSSFDPEQVRGGDNLYSVYWLYNLTGDAKLLRLAEKIHKRTANWELKGDLPTWHNVHIVEGFREPATHYLQSHDQTELQATYDDFREVRKRYGQVPGGMFGGDEQCRPGFSDPHQAVETCGMVEQMLSDELLLQISGDPFWADSCETIAFNSYPAALTTDLRALRYLTAPNQVVSDEENHAPGTRNRGPMMDMDPFSYRCCQHNHSMGWPYFAEHLWFATPDDGLCAAIYSASTATARVGKGVEVRIQETTNYPFDSTIRLRLHLANQARFPLYLRVPAWCGSATVDVNDQPFQTPGVAGKYLRLENSWKEGDSVVLNLPMAVTVQRWTANHNSISVNYGPLSFSLLIGERYDREDGTAIACFDAQWRKNPDASRWPAFGIHPTTAWNYGLALDAGQPGASFHVKRRAWPTDDYPFSAASCPLVIQTQARKIPQWTLDQDGLCGVLQESPVATEERLEDVTLIPMGAARLRVAAFPTVANDGAGHRWFAPNHTQSVVWSIENAVEAESLVSSALTDDGTAMNMELFPDNGNIWSNRRVLLWRPDRIGAALTLDLPCDSEGRFHLLARVGSGPNGATIRFTVNGLPAGDEIDLNTPKSAPMDISLGIVAFHPGSNKVTIGVTGINGTNPRAKSASVVLDAFVIEATKDAPDPWGISH